MTPTFELEFRADKQKMKRVLLYISLIAVLAWVAHLLGNIFWDEYTCEVYSIRYTTNVGKGWLVNLYWWGLYIGIIAPISFVLIYVIMNKKEPSLALNKEGLFINQQLIKQILVAWKDILKIEKQTDNKNISLEIYFKDANKIIEKQSGAKQAFLKENLKDGKPLKCDNRMVTGDFNVFAEKANMYLKT